MYKHAAEIWMGGTTLGMLRAGHRAAIEIFVVVEAHDAAAIVHAVWRRVSQLRGLKGLLDIIDSAGPTCAAPAPQPSRPSSHLSPACRRQRTVD